MTCVAQPPPGVALLPRLASLQTGGPPAGVGIFRVGHPASLGTRMLCTSPSARMQLPGSPHQDKTCRRGARQQACSASAGACCFCTTGPLRGCPPCRPKAAAPLPRSPRAPQGSNNGAPLVALNTPVAYTFVWYAPTGQASWLASNEMSSTLSGASWISEAPPASQAPLRLDGAQTHASVPALQLTAASSGGPAGALHLAALARPAMPPC